MKMKSQTATISYCPDLTDPGCRSVPVAALVIGEISDLDGKKVWLAGAAAIDAKQLDLDPLSAVMLSDVQHLVRRHTDEVFKSPVSSTHAALLALRESLKTSISVSGIGGAQDFEFESIEDAADLVIKQATETLRECLQSSPAPVVIRSKPGALEPLSDRARLLARGAWPVDAPPLQATA